MVDVKVATFISKLEASEVYQTEGAKVDFALELKRLMDQRGLNNARLAERLGVSRPMVTKLLSGDTNITIESMAKVAYKLDSRIFIKLVRKDSVAHLIEVARSAEQIRANESTSRGAQRAAGAQSWNITANNDTYSHEAESLAA